MPIVKQAPNGVAVIEFTDAELNQDNTNRLYRAMMYGFDVATDQRGVGGRNFEPCVVRERREGGKVILELNITVQNYNERAGVIAAGRGLGVFIGHPLPAAVSTWRDVREAVARDQASPFAGLIGPEAYEALARKVGF